MPTGNTEKQRKQQRTATCTGRRERSADGVHLPPGDGHDEDEERGGDEAEHDGGRQAGRDAVRARQAGLLDAEPDEGGELEEHAQAVEEVGGGHDAVEAEEGHAQRDGPWSIIRILFPTAIGDVLLPIVIHVCMRLESSTRTQQLALDPVLACDAVAALEVVAAAPGVACLAAAGVPTPAGATAGGDGG